MIPKYVKRGLVALALLGAGYAANELRHSSQKETCFSVTYYTPSDHYGIQQRHTSSTFTADEYKEFLRGRNYNEIMSVSSFECSE